MRPLFEISKISMNLFKTKLKTFNIKGLNPNSISKLNKGFIYFRNNHKIHLCIYKLEFEYF